jgi:hypothetical protein
MVVVLRAHDLQRLMTAFVIRVDISPPPQEAERDSRNGPGAKRG